MNSEAKAAFEAAFENYEKGSLFNYKDVQYGFEAALEWVKSGQMGGEEPSPLMVSILERYPEVSYQEFKQFLSDVHTAAGLVWHGNRSKALSERLSNAVMRLLLNDKNQTTSQPAQCLACNDTGKRHEAFAGFPPENYVPKLVVCECQSTLSAVVHWLPAETAPKDGTICRLLVEFEEHDLADSSEPTVTIGFNTLNDNGEDFWHLVGWDWCHDVFTQGSGKVIGWLPLVETEILPAAREPVQPHYKVAIDQWFEKTDWVQEKKDWPFPALGMHRADVMTKYIKHLERRVQGQVTDILRAVDILGQVADSTKDKP